MLGLNFDITVDVKKVTMPIHFEKRNECVHCGVTNSLVFVDKFGKESRIEINAFDHIKCKRCNRIYSILWQKDGDNDVMFPCAVNPSISRDINNLFDIKNIKDSGDKNI